MPFQPDHIGHFQTLASLRPPRATRVIAWLLMIGITVTTVALFTVPWVQTANGQGQVVALNPEDRVQSVTALVPGVVEEWFVSDGDEVKRGDPIARIVDNDPDLLARLRAERDQVRAEIAAVQQAQQVAGIEVRRSRQLFAEGLAARRELEDAQITVAGYQATLAEARAKLNRIDVSLNRQSAQTVRAPRAGRIQTIAPMAGGTMVSAGDELAQLAPTQSARVVQLMIDGRDVALVRPGQRVRLEFEGWPAIQFSGWPSVAQGMFDGQVRSIDPSASPDGLFRVLVQPRPGGAGWPDPAIVRMGAKVQGWVQMETVTIGFELWRQLNDFPLQFPRGETPTAGASDPTAK